MLMSACSSAMANIEHTQSRLASGQSLRYFTPASCVFVVVVCKREKKDNRLMTFLSPNLVLRTLYKTTLRARTAHAQLPGLRVFAGTGHWVEGA